MNYIYDILVNFNDKEVYDFYEWDQSDNIEHLRKIPIFKVDFKTLKDFKEYNIVIDKTFLKNIKNKTEVFSNKLINYIEYSAIFTDSSDLVIMEFDNDGKNVLKSSMLLDELEDTLEESEMLEETKILYNKKNKISSNEFMTRNEKTVLNYIRKEINYLTKVKNYDKLKYLYFEWYNKKENDINKIISGLHKILEIGFNSNHRKLFDLIKFSNIKK